MEKLRFWAWPGIAALLVSGAAGQDDPVLRQPAAPGPRPIVVELDEASPREAETRDPALPPLPGAAPPPASTPVPIPDSAGTPGAPEPGLSQPASQEVKREADEVISGQVGGEAPAARPAVAEKTVPLSLRECIALALKNNLEVAIEELNPIIAEADLLASEGRFDPALRGELTYQENSQPIIVDSFTGFDTVAGGQRVARYDISLDQQFAPGTQFNIGTDSRNSQSSSDQFEDEFRSFVGFSATQPLLSGFGTDVNLGPIRIARSGVIAADAGFEYQLQRTITDVANAYYELIFRRDDFVAQEKSLQLAEQLREDNEARVGIGVMSPLDISQASSEVATRREELLRAERAIRDQENTLKRLITDELMSWLDKRLYPTTVPESDYQAPPVVASITEALKNRADLKEALEVLKQRNIQVVIDQNAVLPTLNLTGSFGYTGLSRDFPRSYEGVFRGEDPTWIVGMVFDMPFPNREARGQRDAAQARERQALLNVKRLEQDIIVQVDNAAGQAKTNAERVRAARAAREYAEEALRAEQEKLNTGTSTSFVVLQLQRDLTQARTRELRAIADLQISLAELAFVQGRTLAKFNVELQRAPGGPVQRRVLERPQKTAQRAKPPEEKPR